VTKIIKKISEEFFNDNSYDVDSGDQLSAALAKELKINLFHLILKLKCSDIKYVCRFI
jgi:hypothetical protein